MAKKPAQKPSGGAGAEGPKRSAPAPAPAPAPKPAPAPAPRPAPAPAPKTADRAESKPAPKPAPKPSPAPKPTPKPSSAPAPSGGVSLNYAQTIEDRVNALLAEGNIEGAKLQAANVKGGGAGVKNVLDRVNRAITAADSFAKGVQAATPTDTTPTGPSDGTGDGDGTGLTEDEINERIRKGIEEALAKDDSARKEAERQDATAFLQDILLQYGMGDLAGEIDRLVRESGNQKSVIQNKIRQTQSYKDRFKGLLNLQQKGVTDIQNEAEYINLETQYRTAFRESGLRDYLGGAGTKAERDAIAKLVGDFSLSVNEVRDRITDAQRVVAETPQEVRDSLQRFYNIDPATLTGYVLDPQRTTGEIQRRANAAIVGGYATRAGLDFGAGVSERIGEFLGGERDITGTQIEPQLTDIAAVQRTTGRLAQLEGGTLTAEETALGQLGLEEAAQRRVRGLQSRERARFGGTAGITSGSLARTPSV